MARVKITEYAAKKLILGSAYQGISYTDKKCILPQKGVFVVKVDQGVKKRFVQGLVALNVPARNIASYIASWQQKGYTRFIIEPHFSHTNAEEVYLSLERVREGIRVLYSVQGGVDIEAHPEAVHTYILTPETSLEIYALKMSLPVAFFRNLIETYNAQHFTFLEINPLVMRAEEISLLDAAVLVDSTAESFIRDGWSASDVIEAGIHHTAEEAVAALSKTTSSSLSIKVLNPDGNIFLLLSGGGGSIVIADEAAEKGAAHMIGNYGEYSGGPTREETHLYAREILSLLIASSAKKKALVIAGGIANFTDIKTTFEGIIDALIEVVGELKKQKIKVFVRRGGPSEEAGLLYMQQYLQKEGIYGSVYGSSAPIVSAISDALRFVQK